MLNISINDQIYEKVLDYGIDDYQSSCKRVIHGSNVFRYLLVALGQVLEVLRLKRVTVNILAY